MFGLTEALARLDDFVGEQLRALGTPGLALGLTDRERLLAVRTYGSADVAARTPVTADTLFEMGSIGKSFTAIALLQLAEAGRIDLHAPVSAYLPWFAVQSDYAPIALHHLLSHTAGIITGTDFAPDPRFEVWALRHTRASAPPGERYHYSNVGYKALGLVLERVTGRPYADVIRDGILRPLDMAATAPVITHNTRRRLAVGYRRWYDDLPGTPDDPLAPETWLETNTGDGCIASTPADMAAYLRMLLNGGRGPGKPLISARSFAALTQRAIATDPQAGTFYGYGLVTWEHEGRRFLSHGGGMPGYFAHMIGDFDDGLGVVAMINGPGDQRTVARYALELLGAALRGRPLPEPPPLPDRRHIPNAAELAGTYTRADRTLVLVADGARLFLQHNAEQIPLESRGPDTFYTDHPHYARFAFHVRRAETAGDRPAEIVELTHGGEWFVPRGRPEPAAEAYPAEWDALPGHYRTHDPWTTNFRVVLRRGQLLLVFPHSPDGLNDESPLVPLPDGSFRVGDDETGPETIRFDTIVDGQALRATLSGCEFYRFFTA